MADSTVAASSAYDDSERTVYIGNVHQTVTDDLLYELFVQVFDTLRLSHLFISSYLLP